MWQQVKSISVLFIGAAFIFSAHGLFTTLIPLYLETRGGSAEIAGFMMSAYYGGFIVGSLHAHRVIRNVGHIRAYAAFAATLVICILLIPLVYGPMFWLSIRFCNGIMMAGLLVTIESWINHAAHDNNRGKVLALYMMTLYISLGGAQFLFHFVTEHMLILFSFIAALICCSIVPMSLTKSSQPPPAKPTLLRIATLFRISPIGIVCSISSGTILGTFYGLGPIFALKMNYTTADIGSFMGIVIISGMFAQWPIGKLSDKYDRRMIIFGVALLLMLSSLGVIVSSIANVTPSLLALFAFGAFATSLAPLSVTHTQTFLTQEQRVAGMSSLLLTFGIGAIIGPLVASVGITVFGPHFLFLFTTYVASLLALFVLFRLTFARTTHADEQAPFFPYPRTTPTASQMMGPNKRENCSENSKCDEFRNITIDREIHHLHQPTLLTEPTEEKIR